MTVYFWFLINPQVVLPVRMPFILGSQSKASAELYLKRTASLLRRTGRRRSLQRLPQEKPAPLESKGAAPGKPKTGTACRALL